MKKNSGFTMVELLVVLVIIGILAAVSTPIFMQNTRKARASEAVATMGLIRQALREHNINNNTYLEVDEGDLKNAPDDADPGLSIELGTVQYFSNDAFTVTTTGLTTANFPNFSNPAPQNFIIEIDGSKSEKCNPPPATEPEDCGIKQTDVDDYRLQMDNSGRVYISYDAGTNWNAY